MIKHFWCAILLAACWQNAWGFVLIGPLPGSGAPTWTGPAGEPWQQEVIGYALPGDVGGPHAIGEGFRRNVPTFYYTGDVTFLDFFGSNGIAAIDSAFAILNNTFTNNPTGLTNGLDGYSPNLSEFPPDTHHFNYLAQSLQLLDLKSVTMTMMMENLGLADPQRFVWTLHDRFAPPGCPFTTEYTVVQRNIDVVNSPLDQIQYTSYINGSLFTYSILEFCGGVPDLALTDPVPVDSLGDDQFTAVASQDSLDELGSYFSGLTRDDVGGLRYLLTTNRLDTENAATGALLLTTNLPPPQLIQTLSFGQFIANLTNDPAALQLLYPDLEITSTTTNFGFTNITILTPTFTNFPGATVTNFSTAVLLTNIDLALFNQQTLTNSPAALLLLYPQLEIISGPVMTFSNVLTPNVVTYITNGGVGSPFGSTRQVTVTNGFSPNFFPIYTNYVFGNLLTNYFARSNKIVVQTISVTNLIGSPFGSSVDTNSKTSNVTLTNTQSGDIFIIPTNWCGFNVLDSTYKQRIPSFTNTLISAASTNSFGTAQFTKNEIYFFTNRIWVVEPGVCEPTLFFETNLVSLVLTNYTYTFANLFTNLPTMQFTNSRVTIITTNIGPCSNGFAGTLCTNVTTQTVTLTNSPSGDFFLIPAAWTCGFQILQVVSTNSFGVTNTIVTPVPPGVTNAGEQFSVTTISSFTNHSIEIQPFLCQTANAGPALRQGIEKIQFVRANFDSLIGQFFQPITNDYKMNEVTNSQIVVQTFRRVVTTPDFLMAAADLSDGPGNNVIYSTPVIARSMIYDQTAVPSGDRGPGVIDGPTVFTFDKVGDIYDNGPGTFVATNSFIAFTEVNQFPQPSGALAWASFDGSTNAPVVYPNGTSIQNLINQILVQIAPTTLPDGTNGVPYPATTFTATGGSFSPPFTWSLGTGSQSLPPGLSLSTDGTLSGTPTQSGTYSGIIIQLTDSLSRTVTWNYSINIQ